MSACQANLFLSCAEHGSEQAAKVVLSKAYRMQARCTQQADELSAQLYAACAGLWRARSVAVTAAPVRSCDVAHTETCISAAQRLSHPNVVATLAYRLCKHHDSPAVSPGPRKRAPGHPLLVALAMKSPRGGGAETPADTQASHSLYLFQEFCNGGSLKEAIARRALAPPALRRRWAPLMSVVKGVAGGMGYLHRMRVCHSRLSPACVLFQVSADACVASLHLATCAFSAWASRCVLQCDLQSACCSPLASSTTSSTTLVR